MWLCIESTFQYKLESSMRVGITPAVFTMVYLVPSLVYSTVVMNNWWTKWMQSCLRLEMRSLDLARRPDICLAVFSWVMGKKPSTVNPETEWESKEQVQLMLCGGSDNYYYVPDFDLGIKHSLFNHCSNLTRFYFLHVLDKVNSLGEVK